ncbi:MAG: hypothetical protein COS68_03655 [Elusimicrobia bacterium CG06_land_8_20_14_3_00_38_11]|nr:MAG: hypothetical protein COS68_03655 [Elusimicrobia bacterium CG06_land_8_20_14_3_00_38_11]
MNVCNLCGSNDLKILFIKSSVNLIKCKSCGLVFIDPLPTLADLKKYYTDKYYFATDSVTGGYDNYFADKENLIRTFTKRISVIENYAKPGKMLDVGCAFGFSLLAAKKRGWDTSGIELSDFASDIARKQGLNVFTGTIDRTPFQDGYYDCITMWDLLEHTIDPKREMLEANKLMKNGGILAISTPDVSSFLERITGSHWLGYQSPRQHLFYFSPKSISHLLKNAGFEVIKIFHIGKFCSLSFVVQRLKHYNLTLAKPLNFIVKFLGIGGFSVYVNPYDTIGVIAKKIK